MNWLKRLFGASPATPADPQEPPKSKDKYVLLYSDAHGRYLVEYKGKYLKWDFTSGTYQTTEYIFYADKFTSEESAMYAIRQHKVYQNKQLWIRKEVE